MKKSSLLLYLLLPIVAFCQNVGVGTTDPKEKLDVNGNINLTGTIKTNGLDGAAGQVLMKNNAGNLVWANFGDYKYLATFRTGSGSWTVPAGVTRVLVEIWGGGGGGNYYAGGGGGAYLSAIIDVAEGNSISYTVGTGGAGGFDNGSVGVSSSAAYAPAGISLLAGPGQPATYTTGPPGIITNGFGGAFSLIPAGFLAYYGARGQNGQVAQHQFLQFPSANMEAANGGPGGDAGNSPNSGGKSNTAYYNITSSSLIRYSNALSNAMGPGGGGGSGLRLLVGTLALGGAGGADGMVVIRY